MMNFYPLAIDTDVQIQINLDTQGVIRVLNDENLKEVAKNYGTLLLSEKLQQAYIGYHKKPIHITRASLSMEMKGHLLPDQLAKYLASFKVPFFLKSVLGQLIQHTGVIDCGEKKRDNNRWIWDLLSLFKR